MRVVAAVVVVVVEMEVVVEVGMKILDMGMPYSCRALLLSRPYPAFSAAVPSVDTDFFCKNS